MYIMYSRSHLLGSIVVALVWLGGTSVAGAATSTPPVAPTTLTIATVNIQNAKLLSHDRGVFRISFDITNRVIPQRDVKFSLQLVSQANNVQSIADQKVFDEKLTLAEHSTVHKEIMYTAPPGISGTFLLVLTSENSSGFPFAIATIGKVTLTPDSGIEVLPSSCYLRVLTDADTAHYFLTQGVDIGPEETLQLTCAVKNHANSVVIVSPSYETHARTVFGQIASATGEEHASISLGPHEKKIITLRLPMAHAPQAYDVQVALKNSLVVSNSVTAHYVLRGSSATIQTLSMDPSSFVKGTTTVISFMWSPSADNFPFSRGQGSASANTYSLVLTDERGHNCAVPITAPLVNVYMQVMLAVTSACPNPHLTLALRDSTGILLAQQEVVATTASPLLFPRLGLLILALFVLGVSLVYISLRHRRRSNLLFSVLFFCITCLSMTIPHPAHADTFCTGGYDSWNEGDGTRGHRYNPCMYMYVANINQFDFSPGMPIQTTGQIKTAVNDNQPVPSNANMQGLIEYTGEMHPLVSGTQLIATQAATPFGDPIQSGTQFSAPADLGHYNLRFIGTGYYVNEMGARASSTASTYVGFSVNQRKGVSNQLPIGNVDALTCTSFSGWAYDPDEPTISISLGLIVSDLNGFSQDTPTYETAMSRLDINTTYGLIGSHGFSYATPDSLKDGALHLVRMVAYDSWGGSAPDLIPGGRILSCSDTAPTATVSGQGCTLSAGACNIFLTTHAVLTNMNRIDIVETAPDGSQTQIMSQPAATTTLSKIATLPGSYIFDLYDHNSGFGFSSFLGTANVHVNPAP